MKKALRFVILLFLVIEILVGGILIAENYRSLGVFGGDFITITLLELLAVLSLYFHIRKFRWKADTTDKGKDLLDLDIILDGNSLEIKLPLFIRASNLIFGFVNATLGFFMKSQLIHMEFDEESNFELVMTIIALFVGFYIAFYIIIEAISWYIQSD